MRIPLFHVDAFTDQPFRGNPAAVCPLQGWLDDECMRKVAAENNLSETAFFVAAGDHYDLRWFTPRCEVSLCGHATLAAGHVLLKLLQPELDSVRFETRHSGPLTVRKDGVIFSMDFPAFGANICPDPPQALLRGLGPGAPPSQCLEANDTYVAVYKTEGAIQQIHPNFALLEQLHPYAVSVTAPGEHTDFVSRYFAPSYGIPEDPVTGSAHSILAPYWSQRLGKKCLHARQVSERGGELWCEMAEDRVKINGGTVLTLQGTLEL
jgi:PhzF family phenazine biosynthesis protein